MIGAVAGFEVTIDGRKARAREHETVLAAARRAGVEIPTLCALEAMPGFGACRLCVVEVSQGGGNGASAEAAAGPGKIVASCAHPASPGLVVRTRTERVDVVRRTVMDLLLARCPESAEVRRMAASLGVERTSFEPDRGRDLCILCGTCVRVCAEVGPRAISAAGRGPAREIATPFGKESAACIGCLACARSCPTDNIAFEDDGAHRRIWGRTFERASCPGCGRRGAVTREQIAYWVRERGWEEDLLSLCDSCKRERTSRVFFGIMRP